MTINTEVNCDSCKQDFVIAFESERMDDGIVRHFFSCPHCQARYTCYYTDAAIREARKDIDKLWDRHAKTVDLQKRDSIGRRILIRQAKLSGLIDELGRKIEGS